MINLKKQKSYLVGIALGDGNLSNPNGRAVRLRITCDKKYPRIISEFISTLHSIFPNNQIGTSLRKGCVDISIYSNQLISLMPWKCGAGPKDAQQATIPSWIKKNRQLLKECLRGLLQTDGSIYFDRGYLMLNFVNTNKTLANDVAQSMITLGYKPNIQTFRQENGKLKYTIRLSRDTKNFISEINFWKE